MSTLLITHPACLDHLTPAGHPERPDRLRAIDRALEQERFQMLARVEAPAAELDVIALCHPMEYVEAVRDATPKKGLVQLDADTSMSPGSFEAALRAAGGAVHAVDEVMAGRAKNAFVATPPPGHPTETARPMAFCLFNNAAIAARHAQKRHGLERAAVVDSTCITATARRTSSGLTAPSCTARPTRCRSTPAPARAGSAATTTPSSMRRCAPAT